MNTRLPAILLFLTLLAALSASGQKARFRDIVLKEGQVDLTLPVVILPDSAVSKKINDFLQINLLEQTTTRAPGKKVFDRIKWSLHNSGLDGLEYTVLMNNGRILSLVFDEEGMGAHPINWQDYYQFDVQTGEPILPEDLFTEEGLRQLDKDLRRRRDIMIGEHIKDLQTDTSKDAVDSIDLSTVREGLSGCDTGEEHKRLSITDTGVLFHTEPCLPHVIQALDMDMEVRYIPQQLAPWLSDYGQEMLMSRRRGANRPDRGPAGMVAAASLYNKPMNGTIGKYAIVMQLETEVAGPGKEIDGFYYYISKGIKIDVSGYFRDGVLSLREEDEHGNVTGSFSGVYERGIYSGTWTNAKTKKTLPFTIKYALL